MGSIITRERSDGSTAYVAQIVLKRKGKIAHRESQTFERHQAAKAWLARRETELAQPGALERGPDPKLLHVIDRSIAETEGEMGDTKEQVLRAVKDHGISELKCSQITSRELVAFAQSLQVQPQTRANYMSHLSPVFTVARPAWGYPLDRKAFDDAMVVLRKLKLIGKGNSRTRRPTLEELDRVMEHFENIRAHRPSSLPMVKITAFAIFATRRQDEITRITWADYEKEAGRGLVRDMKHPGDKKGNDVFCTIPPEAIQIIESMPQTHAEIFPYSAESISAAWTRACQFIGIEDLHFHDLRHEGISRLFEMGKGIPEVSSISGHRSWASLKRYTHLHKIGDKYEGWKWLQVVTKPEAAIAQSAA